MPLVIFLHFKIFIIYEKSNVYKVANYCQLHLYANLYILVLRNVDNLSKISIYKEKIHLLPIVVIELNPPKVLEIDGVQLWFPH